MSVTETNAMFYDLLMKKKKNDVYMNLDLSSMDTQGKAMQREKMYSTLQRYMQEIQQSIV